MNDKPLPLYQRSLLQTNQMMCDICGRPRGGNHPISHAKCSKIRQSRGFENGVAG